jgi:ADP-ribosylglycohydrolase
VTTLESTDRAVGCLVAGAIGDALGAPIEFHSLDRIRAEHGPAGLTGFVPAYGRRGAITDDTQMTLFTTEALIGRAPADRPDALRAAYLRWLGTQDGSPAGDSASGLLAFAELHSLRAPGNTCLSALRATRDGARGSVAEPINDSKGCGGVMRAAPAGLVSKDPDEAFELGCDLAAITHGHPSGYLPAGVLAAAVHLLLQGESLDTAIGRGVGLVHDRPGGQETTRALGDALGLAKAGRPTPEQLEGLGGGWIGEEALAIAVAAALTADDLADGLLLAVNHSGDSDSTGSLCGNLLGARDGLAAVPKPWLDELELRDVVVASARALVT